MFLHRRAMTMLVAVVLVAATTTTTCAAPAPPPSGVFPLVGGSTRHAASDYAALKAMGANGGRVYASWAYIEQNVTKSLNTSLTLADVVARPELADAWAASPNVVWTEVDGRVADMAAAVPHVVLQVGGGATNSLPHYGADDIADPNVIGAEVYLAYMYMTSFACAKRYVASGVHLYQIENELNEAYLASIAGQRRRQVLGSLWRDWDFLTRLLGTLKAAVVAGHAAGAAELGEAARTALSPPMVTQNVHTDVAKWVHTVLDLKGFYTDAIAAWAPMLDWVSMDAYPNMVVATPCLASVVGERVKAARSVLATIGQADKPVMIMETGYPVCGAGCNASTTFPAAANYTQANQASCVAATVDAVFANGGLGFFFFTISATPGIVPPPGGYTAEDVSALNMIAALYENHEDPVVLLEWIFGKGHVKYLESKRFADMIGGIASALGALDADGHPRPVVDALRAAYAKHR
ncbi:uncharacterized protein AMSG_04865 [Thecamonas trahens ATCC 50062]|uniref:Uncharacterized protein n=1 Tax=Thecamonas trahens ATCC 50062 TaxID=461836 RepID=A0A0L0D8K6_THETB|nr:hypothetical protein AMSG_04865 [Thecamonas trahens ATCC 50062]KNC48416.1 hypothetical protein AMSG_04865 [Thecamonas trahens ATCC 50062]|eukprot:XP_013758534.1 hypothetical protein AMSG_04865 [Thecamonas trahens ATCC 50062]